MTQHDNTNRGAIWGNEKKEKDTHPDFTGSLNVEGVEYWVSAWKRKPDAGPKAPALSFSVKAKDEAPQRTSGGANQARGGNPDDDIPFRRVGGLA